MSKVNNQTQFDQNKLVGYSLEVLIFTDAVPLQIGIKKIYIYISIYIFIYIGHLFNKHDLALICVDTRGKIRRGKCKLENKRRPIPLTQSTLLTPQDPRLHFGGDPKQTTKMFHISHQIEK